MGRRNKNRQSPNGTPYRHNAPRYLTIDSTDDEIEACVERARQEFYDAWHAYVSDFE